MKVTLTYFDHDSMTVEEVVRRAIQNYGSDVTVEVSPESLNTSDILYFCVQKMITYDQLSALFNEPHKYNESVKEIKAKVTLALNTELEKVIKDNEIRVT